MTTERRDLSVTLRPFEPTDLARLAEWLRAPHVAPWYAEPEEDLAWATAPPSGGAQAIIVSDGAAVGYLRWQRVDREALDALGLHEIPNGSVDADILIGETGGTGRGIGPLALSALVAELQREGTVPLIGLTSELANTRAHRAFEKAGFQIARQYAVPRLGPCHLLIRDLREEEGGPSRPGD
jgi:RimJ/RimL family protein N-acetyltransferase